jgi:hypothetical protein
MKATDLIVPMWSRVGRILRLLTNLRRDATRAGKPSPGNVKTGTFDFGTRPRDTYSIDLWFSRTDAIVI